MCFVAHGPSLARRVGHQIFAVFVTAAVSVLGYLGLLGWVIGKNVWGRVDYYPEPYASWQVAMLIVVLAVTAAWAGARGSGPAAAVTAAVTVTACFFIDNWTQPGDGLWGVTILPILAGTFGGFWVVAIASAQVCQRKRDEPVRR